MEILLMTPIFLILLGGIYFLYASDKDKHSKGFWKECRSLIIIAAVFCLLMGGCVRGCDTSSSRYNSDGFNEVTGEYDQQRVIDHFYK